MKNTTTTSKLLAVIAALSIGQVVQAEAQGQKAVVKVDKTRFAQAVASLSEKGYGLKVVSVDEDSVLIQVTAATAASELIGEGEFFAIPEVEVAGRAGRCPPGRIVT